MSIYCVPYMTGVGVTQVILVNIFHIYIIIYVHIAICISIDT